MARQGSKKRLYLSTKRKKKIVSVGLLKWRSQRYRMSVGDSNQASSSSKKDNGNDASVPFTAEPSMEAIHVESPSMSTLNSVVNDEVSFPDIFGPCTSSTPIPKVNHCISQRTVRRKLDLNGTTSGIVEESVENAVPMEITGNELNTTVADYIVAGRRVVNINYIFNQIRDINNHNNAFGCSFGNMNIVSEKRFGLKSKFRLKCNMCNLECNLKTDDDSGMDINTASVVGAMAVGIGHSQLKELCSTMEIPVMASDTYQKYHDQVADAWESTALQEMEVAAKLEIQHAVEQGRVTRDGIPILTVVADGSWAKRSYRTNYNSLSGVAAIVGSHTKKVLYLGVRNKYYTVCARSEAKGSETPTHTCYKNWSGSSSSMEADIILEGFQRSMDMYGAIYGTILADGDSNVYCKIVEYLPYANYTVDKIECSSHLLRNYCTKLRALVIDKNVGPIHLRKLVGKNVLRLRTAVTKAAKYRQGQTTSKFGEKVSLLQKDIVNSPSHIFGEHLKCKELEYFCKGKEETEKNFVPEMRQCGIYQQVMWHVSVLADNAKSLILNETNNPAEHFNSIIAKFVGGKRVNFAKKRSYQARCSAAVVSHNTKQPLYTLHKSMFKTSPGKVLKKGVHNQGLYSFKLN